VAGGSNATATLSEPIAASSVTSSTFVLRDPGGATVAAAVSANGSTATLDPTGTLSPSTTYTATLSGGPSGIKDLAGNALAANFSWSFTIAAAVDTTPPTVSSVTPPPGATGVGTTTDLIATFDEAIAGSSVTPSTFVLKDAGGATVAATVSASGSAATLHPSAALSPSTTYTAILSGGAVGITDTAGNVLAANFSWSFTTVAPVDTTPPTVSSVTPPAGATGVGTTTDLIATFSESIAASSVTTNTFVLRDAGGATVPASASANGPAATLHPSAALSPSTTYTATLSGGAVGITDTAGNVLAANFSWSFTTAAPVDTIPPTVSSATPPPGASGVAVGSDVAATFSEPIATASVTPSTFVLRDPGGATVAAAVSTNGSIATLDPTGVLNPSTTYTATLSGGAGGITDMAGNALAANFSWSFTTADTTPPASTTTFPAASAAYNASRWNAGCASAGVCGTASDAGSGVAKVELSIRQGSGDYWNGSAFASPTETFVSAAGTTSWSYALPAASLSTDGQYTIRVRATDNAGNIEAASSRTFTYDTSLPAVNSTFPAALAAYNVANWNAGCTPSGVCGTASDGGSGLQKVEVSLRRGTGNYWNGTGFSSAAEVWVAATGTAAWNYAFAASKFGQQAQYTVRVRVTDLAGNVLTTPGTSFLYDTAKPTSDVTFPVASGSYTTATWNAGCPVPGVCGTASDASSGVARVELSIRRGSNIYWNGTAFSGSTEIFFTAAGTTAWSFALAAANFPASANYTIRVRATDSAGNVENVAATKFSFAP